MPELPLNSESETSNHSFGLEQAEVEMLLSLKQEEGLSFDCAVRSAVCASGNEILFPFPEERFDVPARAVWAILLHTGSEDACIYIYECSKTGEFLVANNDEIDPCLLSLATSHARVMSCIAADPVRNDQMH